MSPKATLSNRTSDWWNASRADKEVPRFPSWCRCRSPRSESNKVFSGWSWSFHCRNGRFCLSILWSTCPEWQCDPPAARCLSDWSITNLKRIINVAATSDTIRCSVAYFLSRRRSSNKTARNSLCSPSVPSPTPKERKWRRRWNPPWPARLMSSILGYFPGGTKPSIQTSRVPLWWINLLS